MSSRGTPTGAVADTFAEWRNLLQPLMSGVPEPLVESLGRVAASSEVILCSPYCLIAVLDEAGELELFPPGYTDTGATAALGRIATSDEARARVLGIAESLRTAGAPARGAEPDRAADALGPVLAVPVRYEGRTVGALFLGRPLGGTPFGAGEEQLAELVAGAAAAVLRRTRVTADFRWQQRWVAETADLTRTVLSGAHGEPLRLMADRVRAMTGADVVAVVRQRLDGGRYEVVTAQGPVEQHLIGEHVDVDTALLVPLAVPSLERTALALFPRAGGPAFTPTETEAAALLAEQVGAALDVAQSRTDRERLALLDERDRIARDLHDHVIQRLFAIGLSLQSVLGQVPGGGADRLTGAVDGLDETIEQIRSTIYRLRGPVLPAPRSVPSKVAELVHEMEPVLGFPAQLEIRGPVEFGIDDEVADDCIAVLREALSNVARHARATRVGVALTASAEQLSLTVVDDGCGMGPSQRRSGLANMKARAVRRHGTMTVAPGEHGGTRLTWTIPV